MRIKRLAAAGHGGLLVAEPVDQRRGFQDAEKAAAHVGARDGSPTRVTVDEVRTIVQL